MWCNRFPCDHQVILESCPLLLRKDWADSRTWWSARTFSSHAVCIVVFPPSLPLKLPSFQGTGTTEYWMSRGWEVLQHFLRRSSPRSTWHGITGCVPLLLRSRPQKDQWSRGTCWACYFAFFIFSHSSSFPLASHTMSLNIEHECLWNPLDHTFSESPPEIRCCESFANLPPEEIFLWIPLNLVLPRFIGIWSHSPRTQHRVAKDVDLGIDVLISSIWSKKLSCSSPRRIFVHFWNSRRSHFRNESFIGSHCWSCTDFSDLFALTFSKSEEADSAVSTACGFPQALLVRGVGLW